MRTRNRIMRLRNLLGALLAGATLAGCNRLDVVNPNQQSSQTFWSSASDAERGLTATYNALPLLGVYGRWQAFANDIRSDIGTARMSPWGDLANFNAFQLSDYNFEVNRQLWAHNYELVSRANQVIANVPSIAMDAARRAQIVGEAKFLRALAYYNLATLYENIPLVTAPLGMNERPPTATPAQTWGQIEQDLVDAAAALPPDPSQSGRPSRWAALGVLGRVRLQMAGTLNMAPKWGEASQVLAQVIGSGKYSLLPNYADNFTLARDNANPESLFEVQNEDMWPTLTGLSFPKMIGPCYRPGGGLAEYNPTYCDGRPTRWYFDEFQKSRTTAGAVDPRLDATILYNRADQASELVYDKTRGSYFVTAPGAAAVRQDTMLFFRKYGETSIRGDQRWDNPINYKVLRYADVLLMQAEALNESNQTPLAFQWVNQVRARASKGPLAGLSQAQLRDSILYERMFELGLESSRFNDLRRQKLLAPALAAHDPDFGTFTAGKSERLPIPTTERNLNPNVKQNEGW